MHIVNAFVLAGFVGCALLLLTAFMSSNGGLYGLAAYLGWFLSAYSGLAYLIRGVVATSQKPHRFWSTLYPVNLGLAFLGLCMFGIRDTSAVIRMAVAVVIGISLAYVVSRTAVLDKPAAPLLLLLLAGAVFLEPVFAVWNLFFAALGGFAIAIALISFLRVRKMDAAT